MVQAKERTDERVADHSTRLILNHWAHRGVRSLGLKKSEVSP